MYVFSHHYANWEVGGWISLNLHKLEKPYANMDHPLHWLRFMMQLGSLQYQVASFSVPQEYFFLTSKLQYWNSLQIFMGAINLHFNFHPPWFSSSLPRCIHARTNCHHHNAIYLLKDFSSKVGDYFFPILSTGGITKHEFRPDFSPLTL